MTGPNAIGNMSYTENLVNNFPTSLCQLLIIGAKCELRLINPFSAELYILGKFAISAELRAANGLPGIIKLIEKNA